MRQKIRSGRGASILFALLIFLICAVVASVVLAASTAAAGRLDAASEMDSRYYSVMSAAELFREALESEGTVTVTRSRTTQTTTQTTYANTESGIEPQGEAAVGVTTKYAALLNGRDLSGDCALTLLQQLALFMVFGEDGVRGDTLLENAWQRDLFGSLTEQTFVLVLELESAELSADALNALKVNVSGTLGNDGTLELAFSNACGADVFTVVMTLTVDVEQTDTEENVSLAPVIERTEEDGTFTETVTSTLCETKTAEISWSVTGIKKAVTYEAS